MCYKYQKGTKNAELLAEFKSVENFPKNACTSVSLGLFYRELSAAGSYYWLPAPLGWKLAYAGNKKTVENNRNWAELLLHDVYFIRSKDPQIHNNHGCKTTINWFSRTCNESKTTLYYWLYTMTLCNLQIY